MIRIKGVTPETQVVAFELDGFEEPAGGAGGWETLERPRQTAAAEWVGTPERTLTLPLLLDGIEKGGVGVDRPIAAQIAVVKSWGVKHISTGRPPVLSVDGSRYTSAATRWVVQAIEWGEFDLDEVDGRIVQQSLTLTLLRFLEPTLAAGPAAKARANKPKPAKKGKGKRRKRKKRK